MVRFARIVALFALLTAIMTWPQAARLATGAKDHQDVYFNMWRFAWVAHALSTSPLRVLDGNMFSPEPRTLTYSDAMPVEAIVAAPLLWARVPPVLVHNLMLLGGIVFSAAGVFVLARSLTGSSAAGITAGIVFAFVPYRFEHYMHMELQWTVWIPWTFWALHRLLETGERRYGALAGLFVALQFMSSIYYGIFLATLLVVASLLMLLELRGPALRRAAAALAIGGAVAVALSLPYAIPYMTTKDRVGGRSADEVSTYSARPRNYIVATPSNYLYGPRSSASGRAERRLFPGVLPMLLAVVGLLLERPRTAAIAYLVALVAAFEMSLGFHGYSYPLLYEHVPFFSGLRAPARLGIFVAFFLAVLAAYGHDALARALPRRAAPVLAIAIGAVLMLEYWVAPLALVPYPNAPPALYRWVAKQPKGLVAEFPMPAPNTLPGDEPRYIYMSTFHWMPMLNGYSGYYPPRYLARLPALRAFPAASAVDVLRQVGVEYVIVHPSSYSPEALDELKSSAAFDQLGRFNDGREDSLLLRVR